MGGPEAWIRVLGPAGMVCRCVAFFLWPIVHHPYFDPDWGLVRRGAKRLLMPSGRFGGLAQEYRIRIGSALCARD